MPRVEKTHRAVLSRPRKERVFEIRRPESTLGWVAVTMVGFTGMLMLALFVANGGIQNLIDIVCDWIWDATVVLMRLVP